MIFTCKLQITKIKGGHRVNKKRRGIADFKDGDSCFPCPDNPKATIEVTSTSSTIPEIVCKGTNFI